MQRDDFGTENFTFFNSKIQFIQTPYEGSVHLLPGRVVTDEGTGTHRWPEWTYSLAYNRFTHRYRGGNPFKTE